MIPVMRSRGSIASTLDALLDMRREADRLLNGFAAENGQNELAWTMPTEVIDTGSEIRFAVEMPGVDPADIELTLENGILTIAGEKKMQREEGQESGYRLLERRYGRYERSFRVPSNVVGDEVRADYEHGVLHITLPKAEEARPRRIRINAAEGTQKIEGR
jgi:HSP20 family protein